MEYDVIFRNGTVIDGSGTRSLRADVAVHSGSIAAVEDLSAATAAEDVDVTGRIVAPGFIDVHTHTDLSHLLSDDHLEVKVAGLRQGVTTEICGNCGSSPFPAPPPELQELDPYMGLLPDGAGRYFSGLDEYRDVMGQAELSANLVPLVGHNAVRSSVMGYADRAPTSSELRSMKRAVARAMDQGAFGLSTGLIYPPGVYSRTEEVIELARVAGRYGRVYASHVRDEADRLEEAIAEAIRIGHEAGLSVEISHHKAAGRSNWGKSHRTLEAISAARDAGLDVTIDVYPYTAGSTALGALLPPWVNEGGIDATLKRLTDPLILQRIDRDFAAGLPGWQNLVALAGWDNVVIAGTEEPAGRSIAEVAQDTGRRPVDVVRELLEDHPGTIIVIHMMDAAEVESLADQRFALVGSDGIALPGQQHPRISGTFARLLRRAADNGTQALVDLVRRSSGLAADKFGIPARGYVEPGKVADVVVFDPAAVRDRSTYARPWLPPEGVDHVLVAGAFAIRAGRVTGERRGEVLSPQ